MTTEKDTQENIKKEVEETVDIKKDREILNNINKGKKGKKSGKVFRTVVWALMAIELVAAVVLYTHLITKDLLPTAYDVVLAILMVVLNVIMFFSVKKKPLAIFMSVVSVLVTVLCIVGSVVLGKVDETFKKVSNNKHYETVQMAVVVRADDKAAKVEDIAGYKVGKTAKEEGMDEFIKVVDSKLDKAAKYKDYETFVEATEALTKKKVDAICINNVYIESVAEIEGYENFPSQVKVIYTKEIKVESKSKKETIKKRKAIDEEGKFIVYLSGIDSYGSVNVKSRSDVNILAVVNTKTGKIQLINTPRDYFVKLPNSGGTKDKLTHAGIYGVKNSMGALEELYDVGINYYFRINFSGFEDVIDELGGIDVYSDVSFTSFEGYSFSKGNNHMSGKKALSYARTRKAFAKGDVQRGNNQMAVIKGMINKMTSTYFLKNYDRIVDNVSDCFQTDIPSDVLYGLVKEQLASNPDWKVESYSVAGTGSKSTTFSMPGLKSYVMIPNESDVKNAKNKIKDTLK